MLCIRGASWEDTCFDQGVMTMRRAENSTAKASTLRPLRAIQRWLSNVPVSDPVDRRNAPMLQAILLIVVSLASLLWIYRIGFSGLPWRSGETVNLLMSSCVVAVFAASIVLIRRGHFQWATRQILAVVSVFLVAAYVQSGFDSQGYEQPVNVVWLVLAGLVVGRPALWAMYAVLLLAFVCGVWVDVANDMAAGAAAEFSVGDRVGSGVIAAGIFLLIALAIDRSVEALRVSLREANERGDQLALANARLGNEIAERERVTAQLIHARKVEAVGHLASGVAHDFNHLIGLVIAYAHRGIRSVDLLEAKDALTHIDSAARRATAVTQTLLSFSRREATRLEIFDVGEVLVEMRPMLGQVLGDRVTLRIELAASPVTICFDRSQFVLIVLNIATNARHAMPDGGAFQIALGTSEAGNVAIDFTDNGHGMSLDVRERIFEPFFTTKPEGQGTGLGLAVASDLVTAAGGSITVRSEPDHGTTLRIDLPLAR